MLHRKLYVWLPLFGSRNDGTYSWGVWHLGVYLEGLRVQGVGVQGLGLPRKPKPLQDDWFIV